MALEIVKIINAPIDSNCYLIYDITISSRCIIVDPGSQQEEKLIRVIEEKCLIPEYIILTHEHFDHCWCVNQLREIYPAVSLVCSAICSIAIQNERLNYSHYSGHEEFRIKPADIVLEDIGWILKWNGYDINFEPAKGHTASGIIFYVTTILFTGDSLIKGTATITKFKSGSDSDFKETLKIIESKKGKNYTIYPGHGDVFSLDDYDLSIALTKNNID